MRMLLILIDTNCCSWSLAFALSSSHLISSSRLSFCESRLPGSSSGMSCCLYHARPSRATVVCRYVCDTHMCVWCVCVCVCVHACMYICTKARRTASLIGLPSILYIYAYTYIHTCVYNAVQHCVCSSQHNIAIHHVAHTHTHVCICTYTHTYIHTPVYIYILLPEYWFHALVLCMGCCLYQAYCSRTHAHMYVCMYVYIHTHPPK